MFKENYKGFIITQKTANRCFDVNKYNAIILRTNEIEKCKKYIDLITKIPIKRTKILYYYCGCYSHGEIIYKYKKENKSYECDFIYLVRHKTCGKFIVDTEFYTRNIYELNDFNKKLLDKLELVEYEKKVLYKKKDSIESLIENYKDI